jgi:hypothetical protein
MADYLQLNIMIINDNTLTEIGDAIFFESTPIWGFVRQYTGFTENFEKEFRYSYNGGITYSDWKTLNNTNLQNVFTSWQEANSNSLSNDLDKKSDLKFQFKYERGGTDSTGVLNFYGLTINGTAIQRELEFKTAKNTIFKDVIDNNIDVFNTTINILEKLYEHGVVPEYVDRKKDEVNTFIEDEDYIALWKNISEFFVVLYVYALRFSKMYWKKELLCEYLADKGIFLCDCDDIVEMQLITQNFYDEIRQRGTVEVFRPKGFQYNVGRRKKYHSTVTEITKTEPVLIDGVEYAQNTLPYGWTFVNGDLYSNDNNYHEVLFFGNTLPTSVSVTAPTEYSGVLKQYNGEYLRLICYSDKCDEFMYNQVNVKDFGWCVGQSSPMYRGLAGQYGSIVKAYEKFKDFVDTTKYPWFGDFSLEEDVLLPTFCIPAILLSASVYEECTAPTIISATIS